MKCSVDSMLYTDLLCFMCVCVFSVELVMYTEIFCYFVEYGNLNGLDTSPE